MSVSVPLTSFFNDVKICVTSYFMYRVSYEGKYCTKFLNQYSFICSKFYKLYKYNINISHNKTMGLRNSFNNPCNKVSHLFWFTILALHETDDVILYIHSVHKHRGNFFTLQNYKMRLKQIRLNWINSMQVKKILFTNVFFSWSLCLLNMF
jgi:hypothetical protein